MPPPTASAGCCSPPPPPPGSLAAPRRGPGGGPRPPSESPAPRAGRDVQFGRWAATACCAFRPGWPGPCWPGIRVTVGHRYKGSLALCRAATQRAYHKRVASEKTSNKYQLSSPQAAPPRRGGAIGRSSIVSTLEGKRLVYYCAFPLISCPGRRRPGPGGLASWETQAVTLGVLVLIMSAGRLLATGR
jgi:hypothetical protein